MGLDGASILVTGGSGSFGKAFVNRVLRESPRRIVIYSRGEHLQEQMEREFSHESLRFFIGDVRDQARLEMAMRDIDVVIHAAAMKVVPKCEVDPIECIRTNVMGAENVVRAAIQKKIQKVVALSTDKACSPCNLYGATKLAAEKLFMAAHHLGGSGGPMFSVVRYGNIMGSRGSVAPLFQRLAAEGKPIPITHPRMTRFVYTLEQAVELVLETLTFMMGTEIVVPKIPSMLITDLAAAIAPDAPQEIVGIRPGEKIHETLLTEDETRFTGEWSRKYVIAPRYEGKVLFPPDWRYNSGTNRDWLGAEELRKLL